MDDVAAAAPPERRLSFAFAKRHGVLVKGFNDGVAEVACRPDTSALSIAEVRRFLRMGMKLQRVDETLFDAMLRSAYEAGSGAMPRKVGFRIGLIDSGIDATHPVLAGAEHREARLRRQVISRTARHGGRLASGRQGRQIRGRDPGRDAVCGGHFLRPWRRLDVAARGRARLDGARECARREHQPGRGEEHPADGTRARDDLARVPARRRRRQRRADRAAAVSRGLSGRRRRDWRRFASTGCCPRPAAESRWISQRWGPASLQPQPLAAASSEMRGTSFATPIVAALLAGSLQAPDAGESAGGADSAGIDCRATSAITASIRLMAKAWSARILHPGRREET